MSALDAFLIVLAVLALLGVIFEEVIHINKAKVTLFFGTMSWMLLFLFSDSPDETSAISAGLHCRNRRIVAVSRRSHDIRRLPE